MIDWSTTQVEAPAPPVELDVLLEQLGLACREVIGSGVVIELASPGRRGDRWRTCAREYGVTHLECGGAGPREASLSLARELLAHRSHGTQVTALRALIAMES